MESNIKKDVLITDEIINSYLNAGEKVIGLGVGGSESLTIFIDNEKSPNTIVRKVLSEKLITAKWDRDGKDVMLAPFKKAKQQAYYLKELPDQAKDFFPIVDNIIERSIPINTFENNSQEYGEFKELIYDMSYIEGIEVSEFIRKHQPTTKVVARLYILIFQVLNEVIHTKRVRKPSTKTLEKSYFKKIENRLKLSRKTSPNVFSDSLLDSKYIYINGVKYLNVKPLLSIFRQSEKYLQILEPSYHSLVMGDTNTENIKITKPEVLIDYINRDDMSFNYHDIGIKFLDPRAIGFYEEGVDTGSDDPMYDNKPWHNSIGQYDVIHSEFFDLDINENHDGMSIDVIPFQEHQYARSYQNIEKHFKNVMDEAWKLKSHTSDKVKNDPHWLIRFAFVMGTHFTAMPPFHFHKNEDGSFFDDYKHQRRPVAIYAEGIKWLNLAMSMLNGSTSKFYGVSVN